MKIAATATACAQDAPDHWSTIRHTAIFDESATFAQLTDFARRVLGDKADWSDLELSKVTEDKSKP